MGWLVIKVPDGDPRQFRLGKLDAGFGRARTNAVPIADTKCSSFHCVVRPSGTGTGRFVLEDAGSRNGTYINGERLEGTHNLVPDDEIIIGQTRMTYTDERPDETIERFHNPDHHYESQVTLQSLPDSVGETVEMGGASATASGAASDTSAGPVSAAPTSSVDEPPAEKPADGAGSAGESETDRNPATDATPSPAAAEPVPRTQPLARKVPTASDPTTESLQAIRDDDVPPPATLADADALAADAASSGDSTSIPLPASASRRSDTTVRMAPGADQTENISLRDLSDLVTASRRQPAVAPPMGPGSRWAVALSGAAVVAFLLGAALVLAIQAAALSPDRLGDTRATGSDDAAVNAAAVTRLSALDVRLDRLEALLTGPMEDSTERQRDELDHLQSDLADLAKLHQQVTRETGLILERVMALNDWLKRIEAGFVSADGAARLSKELAQLRAAVTDLRGQLATLLPDHRHELVDNSSPTEPANASGATNSANGPGNSDR